MNPNWMKLIILNLVLPLSAVQWAQVADLAGGLMQEYTFRSIVLVYSSHVEFNDEYSDQFETPLLTAFQIPVVTLSKYPNRQLKHFLNQEILVFIVLEDLNWMHNRYVVDVHIATLRGLLNSKTVFVVNNPIKNNEVYKFFEPWTWDEGVINTLVVFQTPSSETSNRIYSFSFFPKFAVENVTHLTPKDFFPDRLSNLQGHVVSSPVRLDAPKIFLNRQGTFAGFGGNLVSLFFHRRNGSVRAMEMADAATANVNVADIFRLMDLKLIDICFHLYGLQNLSERSVTFPTLMSDWCTMVPLSNQLPEYMYILLPFHTNVWICIGLMGAFIVFVKTVFVKIIDDRWDFGLALHTALSAILFIPFPYGLPCTRQAITLYGQLLLLGFILSNFYLAHMTTFLTNYVYGPQIDNIEDLIQAKIPIMVVNYEVNNLLRTANYPEAFKDLIKVVDADTLAVHREKLNTTYVYTLSRERWVYLLNQQKVFKRPLYRVINVCFGTYPLGFPLPFDSPYLEPLSYFTIIAQQHGLLKHWQDRVFEEAVEMGLVDRFAEDVVNHNDKVHALEVKHLRLIWVILLFGLGLSCCCFTAELLWALLWHKRTLISIRVGIHKNKSSHDV